MSEPVEAADLLVLGARVCTLDPAQPEAEAVAVRGEVIRALGREEDLRALAGPRTRIIDAQGGLLLPGFIDAHVHFVDGGFALAQVDLRGITDLDEFQRRVATAAQAAPKERWILGSGWQAADWRPPVRLTRDLLDRAAPDHPVCLTSLDGHSVLVNSVALRLAGLDSNTPDPPGGGLERDPKTGQLTGVLYDAAVDLVRRVIPPPSRAERIAAARRATAQAAGLGVTSVHDVLGGPDVELYIELAEQGELKTRIYAAWPIRRWKELLPQCRIPQAWGSWIQAHAVKAFADGSLGSSTAWFFESYANQPEWLGLIAEDMLPQEAGLERLCEADAANLQILLHAIGDRANAVALDCCAALNRRHGPADRRFRIEHAQHLRPQDIPRFGELDAIASVQPAHLIQDGPWAEKLLGPQRVRTTYAFRSLLEAGAGLAFGSDWPVAPLNPMVGLQAAVTRLPHGSDQPFVPEERLTLEQALRANTIGSAYAERAELHKGTLSIGKWADMVLLDRDIFKLQPREIAQARVICTIVGGRVVYDAGL